MFIITFLSLPDKPRKKNNKQSEKQVTTVINTNRTKPVLKFWLISVGSTLANKATITTGNTTLHKKSFMENRAISFTINNLETNAMKVTNTATTITAYAGAPSFRTQ